MPHSPKFGFLAKHHSLLVRYAAQAERLVLEVANLALIRLWQFAELLAQNANNRYYFSLDIASDVPIVASMRHYDTTLGTTQPAGGDSTIGTQRWQILALNNL